MLLTTARNGAPARRVLDPARNGGQSVTRRDYYNGFATGNAFVVPRRGWDQQTALFASDVSAAGNRALSYWVGYSPLVVLSVLIEKHPIAAAALKTDLSMMFDPEDISFEAVDQAGAVSDNGTQALTQLEERLPPDTGGYVGVLRQLATQQTSTGLGCLEAVPGTAGLDDLLTFSPLTVQFLDQPDGRRTAQQAQGGGNWVDLPEETCYVVPWMGSRDNPYGLPHYGPLLGEGLADISEEKDLRDWFHQFAWSRLAVYFPHQAVYQYALELAKSTETGDGTRILGSAADGGDETPSEFVARVENDFRAKFAGMKSDDAFFLASGGDVKGIAAGSPQGLDTVLDRRTQRIANACDILPGLIGYTFGGTQAYSKEQLRAQAKKWTARRYWAIGILVKALNLHLRLLGMPLTVRPKCAAILPSDRLADAQAEEIEIRNAREKVICGFWTPDDASIAITGSGVVDRAKADSIGQIVTQPASNPVPDPNNANA